MIREGKLGTRVDLGKLEDIFSKHPERNNTNLVIPVLQEIQQIYGYLPAEALKKMSRHFNIPLSHIYGVATFYAQFSLEPRGKNLIKLCQGTACHIRGGKEVLKAVENLLGIGHKGTTSDFKFSLEVVRCLGTCFLAPVMMINRNYYGKLTPEKVRQILKSY
ncbi:NAD(P)H-dependent oxidoreductase subunit E [Candidatus Desantisbacteria bacterium CG1_02_38_46]|uniref:NADH-quinone oxidoreductase subunit NuoE n=3 Tax=unclassified Candidatus Desantisiibacteriota TaxID=3106372 RepID=A0A2H9P9U1_9BACT|nr:MAG: NAD(P)H-dependent oxidoreductase subunit E [Candidatus Desantisbacteria bacterium CG1_02_38_46]PIU52284.1 MAG: NADH-quinone oxidoreductase subunit NuoE [Candidatus Desantisbacteria bacterium CG07_land_8_20_14_0_80_39_15]PIZ15073.1 MAG: NADH-quinone oxidoreductase subunit NuoE [Candidatus Desantisbacteria bacterium CG_4_10_14_0_8_um_filter_39_17]